MRSHFGENIKSVSVAYRRYRTLSKSATGILRTTSRKGDRTINYSAAGAKTTPSYNCAIART
ncbi:hypothetical protein [Fortiea contorta]|uniref:hypothetical protein n=1 Tax=Fortiea contorta TaxID=1892405 RepID=UPI0003497DA4|nr:hypothetical protein [Fortiea contorta]